MKNHNNFSSFLNTVNNSVVWIDLIVAMRMSKVVNSFSYAGQNMNLDAKRNCFTPSFTYVSDTELVMRVGRS